MSSEETYTGPIWVEVKQEINDTMLVLGVSVSPELREWQASTTLGQIFPMPDLDSPWYHCRKCIDNGKSKYEARLSISDKFCAQCGTKLDWDRGFDGGNPFDRD